MSNNAHEETYRGCKIRLEYEDSPGSPREWGNVGTMVCWHSRYNLGDEQPKASSDDWVLNFVQGGARWEEEKDRREQAIRDEYRPKLASIEDDEERLNLSDEMDRDLDSVESGMEDDEKLRWGLFEKDHVVLPLYLYDHSGITISTGKFSCPWDSGQVGFIYCSKAKAREEWGEKHSPGITDDEIWKKAEDCLRGEVQTYDDYLTGQVVGFVAEDPDGEEIDSCWGFYPEREPGKEDYAYCLSEARGAVDHWCKEQETEAAERAYWACRDVETVGA